MICADVELHYSILDRLGDGFFKDHYNIGIWAWELPTFPEKWHDRFAFYDEVWVGTSFVAEALATVSPVPVLRIPPVIDLTAQGSRESGRRKLAIDEDQFVFLFVFDYHSHDERKNPRAVIEAFKLAFGKGDKARLVIKCVNADSSAQAFAALQDSARNHAVTIVDGYWSAEEMRDLMASCDAYVSLHRAEGTGLTLAEAMVQGKPVIATGWSGNTDFMDVNNSYPVRYEMTRIARSVGPYMAGQTWAEPCLDHAADCMRDVFENRAEAEARACAGRRTIEEGYSAEAVTEAIARRLETIQLRRSLPRFRDEKWQAYRSYRQLTASLCEVADRALPANATVLVASKGDDRLLQLPGRKARHFPCTDDGTYAGYYPADSEDAIRQLEAERSRGAGYLLLPYTAYWWLEQYRGFAEHLDTRYTRVWHDDRFMVFDIESGPRLGSERRLCELKPLAARIDDLVRRENQLRHQLLNVGSNEPVRNHARQATAAFDALDANVAACEVDDVGQWRAGETRTYSVTLTNAGSAAWNAHGSEIVRLGVHFGGDSDVPGDEWATDQRFALPHDVGPGAAVTFEVSVTAPSRAGLYVLRHRVVKEDVAWFKQIYKSPSRVEAEQAGKQIPASATWLDTARAQRQGNLPGRLISYHHLAQNLREIASNRLTGEGTVLVVSKGDADLLHVHGRRAEHFPQMPSMDGSYAGHHPADSNAAIEQLEALRRGGAMFLMLPSPSFWWLDFYKAFAAHLDQNYQRVWDNEDAIVFRLGPVETTAAASTALPKGVSSLLRKLRAL